MPSEYLSSPPAYHSYPRGAEDTPTPGSLAASTSRHHRTNQTIQEEKRSLIDELLPVPVTVQTHSASPQIAMHGSIRRISSLGVIVVFLLTITFYGTAIVGQVDKVAGMTSMKSVIGGLVGSVGGSLKGVQDDVSEKEGQLDLGEGEDAVSGEAGIWDDAPMSEIEPQSMQGMSNNGLTTASRPDWSKYTFLRTLPPSALELEKPKRRLIFVGDIHGSYRPLKKLMKKLSYDPSHDKVVHVGDVIVKGPEPHAVLDYLRENKVKGVRGNHDEKVIEWCSWMRWTGKGYQSSNSAVRRESEDDDEAWRSFIDDLDAQFPPSAEDEGLSKSQQEQLETLLAAKAKSFPKEWSWRSEHWNIARRLSRENYQYLVDLPLTLHLPSVHSIVVHAGLLARDPTKKATAEDQPYAEIIAAGVSDVTGEDNMNNLPRTEREIALLRSIPQNRDPYTLLNVRSVLKDGEVTKKADKGTPWSDIWHEEMSRCTGSGADLADDSDEQGSSKDDEDIERVEGEERRDVKRKKGSKTLPKMDCSPITVIYGHAAGRGLDIKKYSKGLDTGCVYGRQLTALVLGDVKATRKIKGAKPVRVGSKEGVLIDIECEKATPGKPE